jgi:hypothetical protein
MDADQSNQADSIALFSAYHATCPLILNPDLNHKSIDVTI